MEQVAVRYFKCPSGWTRLTLAFMSYLQWKDRSHYVYHGFGLPTGPRNYQVWPVIEQLTGRIGQ
jgi:hypothetical protein